MVQFIWCNMIVDVWISISGSLSQVSQIIYRWLLTSEQTLSANKDQNAWSASEHCRITLMWLSTLGDWDIKISCLRHLIHNRIVLTTDLLSLCFIFMLSWCLIYAHWQLLKGTQWQRLSIEYNANPIERKSGKKRIYHEKWNPKIPMQAD